MEPLVSIILPARNAGATIERAIRSVLAQTWQNWEILVIDDGSTDDTGRIVEKLSAMLSPADGDSLQEGHARQAGSIGGTEEGKGTTSDSHGMTGIRMARTEGIGVSGARNLGLTLARGELITFLDADDAFLPDMLTRLYDLLTRTGADYAGCGFVIDGHEAPGADTEDIFQGRDIVTGALLKRDTRLWSKLFLRQTIGDKRFQEGLTIGEDMLFLLDLVGEDTLYARTEEKLYHYTLNQQGAMEKPYTPAYMDQVRCWEEARERIASRMPRILREGSGDAELSAIEAISAMLVASKIARTGQDAGRKYRKELELLRDRVKQSLQTPGARGYLLPGYGIKTRLFLTWPGLYCFLYGMK